MDENMTEQKPSETAQKGRGLGWVWVAVIVIIVAGILFVTQKKAPTNEANETNQAAAPVVKDIPVTPTLGGVPKSVPTGSLFGLDWNVAASEQTFASATGLVWDVTSHPGDLATSVTPETSGYPSATTTYNSGLTAIPGAFEDNIKLSTSSTAGALYLRVYATVAGKTYWSQEYIIPTKAQGASTAGGS